MREAAVVFLVAASFGAALARGETKLDLLAATPQGSWQSREQNVTGADGQKFITIKTSLVGEEQRGGEPHVWIEVETSARQIDQKGRTTEKKPVVAKVLVKRSDLS